MKNPIARITITATILALLASLALTSTARADDPPQPPAADETVVVTPPEEEVVAETQPLLESLPENSTLVVVVEEQIVPLGSTAAANAVLTGDPIWCPEGTAPTPSANGCTDSYPTLESLINDFDTSTLPEPNQHGTIWIMAGADASTADLVIDGATFSSWSDYRLTVQGGWDGSSAGTISGSSSFTVPISVINWNNQVMLSHLAIENADATGLEVSTTGDIVLEDISASNNQGYGADLLADGNITLNGSNNFNGNLDSGLLAEAGGEINANNVTAGDNGGAGAELYAANDINLTGNNTLNTNGSSGLFVDAGGDASLESIEASGNGEYGAEVYASGSVTLSGDNLLENNNYSGLSVDAGGDVVIDNLSANANGDYGAEIYTSGSVSIRNTSANNNTYSGLYIEADGDVALENITASGNGHSGAYGSGIEVYTLEDFDLTGLNTFNDNYFEGLYVDALGNIFILNVFAEGNGTSGVYLESAGQARIECSTFTNNTGPEIEAYLSGVLTLAGVDFGGDLDNEVAVDEDYLVLISNACFTYPNNDEAGGQGSPLPNTSAFTIRPIQRVTGSAPVELDCGLYQGTLITLDNGDGAYIPCPIVDTAQLVDLANVTLPGELPGTYSFMSGFLLTILKEGQALGPLNYPNAIWYASPEQIQRSKVQAFYWNGTEWVELTDQITPFMRLFFEIPAELKGAELAILYWDGTAWVEIKETGHLGNGYLIQQGGHLSADGLYFETTLNFTGTFVLVKK